jgi:hypothetical protein
VGIIVAPHGRLLSIAGLTFVNGKITEMEMIADPERLRAIDLRALGWASEVDDAKSLIQAKRAVKEARKLASPKPEHRRKTYCKNILRSVRVLRRRSEALLGKTA